MILTRARALSSPNRPPPRPRALGAGPRLVAMLVCCTCLVGGTPLRALDLDGIMRIQQRDEAVRDLKQAQDKVESARAQVETARKGLDAFLSRHFATEHVQPPPATPDVEIALLPDPEVARLKTQLHQLQAHREDLLGYLTEEHPQVIDVDVRIATVEERIANQAAAPGPTQPHAGPQTVEVDRKWADYASRLTRQSEQDGAEFRQLYAEWQAANRALDDALKAERAAKRPLETIPELTAETAVATNAEPGTAAAREPRGGNATAAEHPALDSGSDATQPLALAALLIALAVAALAAVRLARSTADPLFASVDEVAAALAMPVVGIIPAAATRMQRAVSEKSARRIWLLVGQFLLAVLVFTVVAVAVQNPAGLWRLCTHPLETLDTLVRAGRGGV